MIKGWMREMTLAVQARTGASVGLLIWIAIMLIAVLTAFIFLCVALYAWLSAQLGSVFAGLATAGIFLVIAGIAAVAFAVTRRQTRQRATLERAARPHPTSWLLDPKILATAVQAGRTLGWQRIMPVALLAIVAAQWAREYRGRGQDQAAD